MSADDLRTLLHHELDASEPVHPPPDLAALHALGRRRHAIRVWGAAAAAAVLVAGVGITAGLVGHAGAGSADGQVATDDDVGTEMAISLPTVDLGGPYAEQAGLEMVISFGSPNCVKGDVIWPAGYTASLSPAGVLTILDADDKAVAQSGDTIMAGGGGHQVTDRRSIQLAGNEELPIIGGDEQCAPAANRSAFVIQGPPRVIAHSARKGTSMTASPTTAQPGEIITLTFGHGTRGVGFRLAGEDGSRFTLMGSDSRNPRPTWDEGFGPMIAVGVVGPGPDYVVIPDVATPGHYALCSEDTIGCVAITVTDDSTG